MMTNTESHPQVHQPSHQIPRWILPCEADRQDDAMPSPPALFAFPPNRDTLGATAYLILAQHGNVLIDCPAWHDQNQQFLQSQGGVQWLCLTHRDGMARVRDLQSALGCEVIVQEQEAYLLPNIAVRSFGQAVTIAPDLEMIWTPGHSPGSACVYWAEWGGVLFSGRHLLPNLHGQLTPQRTAKTFHWRRQLNSVQILLQRFSPDTLHYLCPGANTGFLRGARLVDAAYGRIQQACPETTLTAN